MNVIQPDEMENVKKMRALESGDQSVGRSMKMIDTEKVQNVLQQAVGWKVRSGTRVSTRRVSSLPPAT